MTEQIIQETYGAEVEPTVYFDRFYTAHQRDDCWRFYDSDRDEYVQLHNSYAATEKLAAAILNMIARGYDQGFWRGEESGRKAAQRDIRCALGIEG